jgi:hypothetical protein
LFGHFLSHLRGRAPFRDRTYGFSALDHVPGNVKTSVTGIIVSKVGVAVIARAYNIQVVCLITGSQPARAGLIAETAFVHYQPAHQLFREICLRIKVVTACFDLFFEAVVAFVHLGWRGD